MPEDDNYFPPVGARRTNSPQHQQQQNGIIRHSTSSSISSPTTPTSWQHHQHQQHRPNLSSAPITSAQRLSTTSHRFRTRSSSLNSDTPPKSMFQTLLTTALSLSRRALTFFFSLPLLHRVAVVIALLVAFTFGLVFLIYSHALFTALGPLAETIRTSSWGWVPISGLMMITGFPPLIGYSTAVTIAGFVYGFPWGWPLAALSTIVGSTAAFMTSRGWLKGYVHNTVGKDRRFVALGQVLRRDGIGVLAMIRLCPLPYSLSNGFLATIGSIGPGRFALATGLTTPKLLVHVFIGSRLALLAESGDKMTGRDKMINYASMLIGGAVGFTVGLLIYKRTMARAAELAREGGEDDLEAGDGLLGGGDGTLREEEEYDQNRLVNPDDMDAANIMTDDDDISLWETESGGYHDAWDDSSETNGTAGIKKGVSNGINGARR
ncbi:hypothetical protein QBC43DRAFT_27073 [Cladorrhinum sp. PSN259]|nr:hypothetical protein QBC43DRAFT_27073 [Cladorrhinum sp. PSN259]